MNNFNDQYCFCKECECDYDFTNNNQYGYFNCCSSCGENKYEEYLEEQEELKKKEINFNDLPCDIMTKIMNINKNQERLECYRNNKRKRTPEGWKNLLKELGEPIQHLN